MKISIADKGGSGKTTTAGTLARVFARQGYSVLAIDGDSNPNLGITLGIPVDELDRVEALPTDLIKDVEDEDGRKQTVLRRSVEEIADAYGTTAADGVKLLAMKKIDHAGKGWACRAHATVRSIIGAHPSDAKTVIVTDMEAGIEHLSRSTTRHSDVMLVVTEPYYRSLETAARIKSMSDELGIPNVYVVANKVRTEAEANALERFCAQRGLEIIATIPYDEKVAESSLVPAAPIDYCPDAVGVTAIAALAERLMNQ